jgi:hypothetical protein
LRRKQADGDQLGIGLIVAGQQGERYVPLAAHGRELLDAVRPIADPAQEAHHHHFGPAHYPVRVEVNREVVAELHEVGEAQARQVVAERPGSSRKVRKLRVGGREDQDVGRLLAEVDRLRAR